MQKNLEIGQIVNTFGIKGYVKVVPYVDNIERYNELKKVYVKSKKETKEYEIEEVKYQKNMVLLKLKGIDKVEEAEKLRNSFLEVDRENAIKLEEGEYFIADLIGMSVITDEGKVLGKLDDIYNRGSSDIYVVKDELGKQILLPAIEEVINEINIEDGKIIIHIIEGLI
ncbi:MAG: 16S rRNA processing protein RimM [Clostridia bacterium]|nr:16S rRNA processing protein RimM [Clostridia bacterium]